jgi:uncharacterized protein (DUF302 family)
MPEQSPLVLAVDELQQQIAANTDRFVPVATIDHARLAGEAGVEMPPCIVTIFSDPESNAPLIQSNPLIGLDLPHRVLTYAEPDASDASIAFGDASYLAQRHGIADAGLLSAYGRVLDEALAATSTEMQLPVVVEGINEGFGIHNLVSEHSFGETVDRLKAVVSGQGDTVWFGDLDFQAEAATQDIAVRSVTMLLFGAPAPGGMCMAEFPRLGLDAFCQKLLVYEDDQRQVRVAFNDIVSFATLHYGRNNAPQEVVNSRLDAAFRSATSR